MTNAGLGNSRSTPALHSVSAKNTGRAIVNGNSNGDWTARFLPRIRPMDTRNEDEFNPCTTLDFTPRATEALRRLGLKTTDLLPRLATEFETTAPNEKIALLRYNFFENQRRATLLDVRQTRNKLIKQHWRPGMGADIKNIERQIERKNAMLTKRSERTRKRLLSRKVQNEVSDIYKEQLAAKQQVEAQASLRHRAQKLREQKKKIQKRNSEQQGRFRQNWQLVQEQERAHHTKLMKKIETNIQKQDELVKKRQEQQADNQGGNEEQRSRVNSRLADMSQSRAKWEETRTRHIINKQEESQRRLNGMKEQILFAYKQKLMDRRQKAETNLGKRRDNSDKIVAKLQEKDLESKQRLRRLEADRRRKVDKARKAEQYRRDKIRDLRLKQLANKKRRLAELDSKHRKQEEAKRLIEQQKNEERMLRTELNRLKDQRRKQVARKRQRSRAYLQDLSAQRIESEDTRFETIQRVKSRVVQNRRDYNTRSQLLREKIEEKLCHAPADILQPSKIATFLGDDILGVIDDPLSSIKKPKAGSDDY